MEQSENAGSELIRDETCVVRSAAMRIWNWDQEDQELAFKKERGVGAE